VSSSLLLLSVGNRFKRSVCPPTYAGRTVITEG
jgi:hypothetical protein